MRMNQKRTARMLACGMGCTAIAGVVGGCTTPSSADAPSVIEPVALAPEVSAPVAVAIEPRGGTERLARGEHPLARPEFDQGRLDPTKRIANLSLFFRPSAEQLRDREALAAAQLDPKSPSFRKWLVPETYRKRFGAQESDIARTTAWLTAQGFEVHRTSPLGNRITFSARVADLESAFQTEMHRYNVGGQEHFAMATAPAMPSDLARVVLGIKNTHNFFPKPLLAQSFAAMSAQRGPMPDRPDYAFNYFDGGADAAFEVLGPPDWATAYDVTKLYDPGIGNKKLDGSGITIGIVGTAAIAQSDIDAFNKTFNLPKRTVTMTLVPDTGPSAGGQGGAGLEAILDVEWSGGIAKGADVNYVYIGSEDGDVDDATIYLIEQNLTPLMSESYGGCEIGIPPSEADITEEYGTAANIMGITYMAAAGDSGADGCLDFGLLGIYGSTPGTFPGVTSVGGTQFPKPDWNKKGDLVSYPDEAVWNESNNPIATQEYMGMAYPIGVGAGGGGISSVFPRPAYQQDLAACDIIGSLPVASNKPMRQTPDISTSAASSTPGYFIECTFDMATQDCSPNGGMPFGTPIGGTSASSPSFTGVIAILNQAIGQRLGNINPMLYQLAAAGKTPSPFHDITEGGNEIVCSAAADGGSPDGGWPDSGCGPAGVQGYHAGVGYDCASGIGSIDGYNLVTAWLGAATTSTTIVPTPTMATEGAEITLRGTVTVDTPNANLLTGIVTYAFESFDSTGAVDNTWELGSTTIEDGTTTSGQTTLTTTVPYGLINPGHQFVDVVAIYGGDVNHLASTSAPTPVQFAAIHFAISPQTSTVEIGGTERLRSTGGVAPITWFTTIDTTVEFTAQGQFIGASQVDNHGNFTGGPQSGYTEVEAVDKDGAEAIAYVTIGSPTTPPPWAMDAGTDAGRDASVKADAGKHVHDAGQAVDAGNNDAGEDSGKPTHKDAGQAHDARADQSTRDDAGEDSEPAGGGGCNCKVATGNSAPGTPAGAGTGIMLALGLVLRRRTSKR